MFHLIIEAVLALIFASVGALVGVLWPARSHEWARWQRCGMVMGMLAVMGLVLALLAVRTFGWGVISCSLLVTASLLAAGYLFVGNRCRAFHEQT